jgi:hypothetical protein
MRSRSLLALVAIAAGLGLRRRRGRKRTSFVDVHFEDGAMVRLTSGPEAEDLLDDARAILEAAS